MAPILAEEVEVEVSGWGSRESSYFPAYKGAVSLGVCLFIVALFFLPQTHIWCRDV